MKNTIIVPIDDSKFSHRALHFALKVAEKMEGEVVLINIQPNIQTANVQRFFSKQEIEQYSLDIGNAILKRTDQITDNSPVQVKKFVRIGVAKVEICAIAKELNAMCIVMGSRGMGPIKGTILGSVSYGVLHSAPCPVTIVP